MRTIPFLEKRGQADPYHTAIAELQRRIQRNDAETRTQLTRLGEYLSYQEADRVPGPEMTGQHRLIRELREKLPASRQQVRRIVYCVERNTELERKLRGLKKAIEEAERRDGELFEEVARASLQLWRSPPDNPELAEIITPLLRKEEEIKTLQEELERLQEDSDRGGLLGPLGKMGRSFRLRGALASRRSAFSQAARAAGRRICELEPPVLERSLEPCRENRRRLQELREEAQALRADQIGLWQELKDLGADRSHQRRVRQIEQEILHLEAELSAACERLGKLYRAAPARVRVADEEASRYLERIGEREADNARLRRQIERLEAAIRMEALDHQNRQMSERVERLEKEIRIRQEEIDLLRARMSEADSERKRLVRLRGAEDTLLMLTGPVDREAAEDRETSPKDREVGPKKRAADPKERESGPKDRKAGSQNQEAAADLETGPKEQEAGEERE